MLDESCGISHIVFAEDMLIFSSGGRDSMLDLKGLISNNETTSLQIISVAKTTFLVDHSMQDSKWATITSLTGFSLYDFPMTYLRVL